MSSEIRTVEQARALREIEDQFYERTVRNKPDGTTVLEKKPRKFFPRGINGDEIIMFLDADGITKKVVYLEDGPAKTPF